MLLADYFLSASRYTRGAWLAGHVDHTTTHVLSAIINLGQRVEEPWPLDIVDYDKRLHKVILEPGDMVWYESSRYASLFQSLWKTLYVDSNTICFPEG